MSELSPRAQYFTRAAVIVTSTMLLAVVISALPFMSWLITALTAPAVFASEAVIAHPALAVITTTVAAAVVAVVALAPPRTPSSTSPTSN